MAFVAGQKITAALLNAAVPLGAVQSTVNSTAGTTTSTSYTDTLTSSSTVSQAFTVPPSGAIWVTITASAFNSGNNFNLTNYRISGAAGTRASNAAWQIFTISTGEEIVSRRTMQTGLTPGASGTVTMQHAVTAGTGTFNHRQILIEPVPA